MASNAPTTKQLDYIEILFNDCGFGTRQARLDYLHRRGIDVNYFDELTMSQASGLIADLKRRKQQGSKTERDDRDDDEADD